MRALILMAMFLGSNAAWAHGPVAEQASKALTRVTTQFLADESKETHEAFEAASVKLIGYERFSVEMSLKGGGKRTYTCGLDETVKPVKWGCKKNN